ncbi:elongator complex protein 5 [Eublepharis macularius]|uniref:Elongator complex protein 5 n=1 Tax=Eublepharis macularius TaxID=481883 RepID=A0AA97K741_EUBMA|nr:elongator complex protein 5 [Eublepharis macularius]
MLGKLAAGGAEGLLLIQDSVSCEGRTLLKSFAAASAQRGECVQVLSFDIPEEEFKAGFSAAAASQLLYHDAFRDPLGWTGQGCGLALEEFGTSELVARLTATTAGPSTVVLDSISWLLLRLPFPRVCQVLAQLPKRAKVAGLKISRIVALLHGDLHQTGQLEALHTLARVVVKVEPAPEPVPGGDGAARVAVTLHRKTGGKVMQKKEYFTVLPDFILKCLGELPEGGVSREENDQEVPVTVDPAANLTFNLRLSEAERQAKESVPLPYQFSEEKKSSLLQTPANLGKIYYEPDAADDVDEEDPDDDLDV